MPILPAVFVRNPVPWRGCCTTCAVCTPRGCLDLSQGKAFLQVLGPDRRSARWLRTPFGLFIAAFPGFIVGYGLTTDGPLATAPLVYATTLAWSVASVGVVALALHVLRAPTRLVLPLIAAGGGWLYYWFAGPAVARQVGEGDGLGTAVRVTGMALVNPWLGWALRRPSGAPWQEAGAAPAG